MGFKNQTGLVFAALLLALLPSVPLLGDSGQKDSLVRLMNAASVQLIEKDGLTYRKAIDATFLHNGTYLISDTALWNVDTKLINANGHVRIIQDETVLTSDRLDYDIDGSLAMFRGTLVQLQDRSRNTLRTLYLDYNTKDSVAVFFKGGSMKDKDGQIMESLDGRYDSQKKVFTFRNEVNMFTDSVFIKTSELEYRTEFSRAIFPCPVDFHKDGNMLSAGSGWYNRPSETFFFKDSVHGLTENQESWSDTLYYYRDINDVLLLGEAQVQDTTRGVAAVADYIYYCDTLSRVSMRSRAAVAMKTESEGGRVDTLYVGADSLVYWTRYKCDISEAESKVAAERRAEMFVDPVEEYRTKAAREAAEAAAEAAKDNPNVPKSRSPHSRSAEERGHAPSGPAPADTTVSAPPADSLAALPEPDSTKIGYLSALGSVKAFRQDIQLCCDSLQYCDLDSIGRFYIDPVVWNEGNRQYSSDSLFILVREGGLDRASLMSEAFIITQEDSLCFDQIKGTEVMAYFDTTSALRRFDALGGSSALFFLRENDVLATVNKVESKMLSGVFVDGTIDRVFYFDNPKNDAYPLVQMPVEDRRMKGFNWQPERRPASKSDITTLSVRPSERAEFESRPEPTFRQTDRFFPGYMKSVYRGIAVRDSLKRIPRPQVRDTVTVPADSLAAGDSLAVPDPGIHPDSLTVRDSLSVSDSLSVRDSLSVKDTLGKGTGVTAVRDSVVKTEAQIKAEARRARKAELAAAREAKKAERIAAREARWAALDARDAAKAEAKKEKQMERKRARTRRLLKSKMKQDAADAAKLEKYKERYQKQKSRNDGKDS